MGIDQEPHLEVTREIARKMNQIYGMEFPEPKKEGLHPLTLAAAMGGVDMPQLDTSMFGDFDLGTPFDSGGLSFPGFGLPQDGQQEGIAGEGGGLGDIGNLLYKLYQLWPSAGTGEFTPEILEMIEAGYGGIVGAGAGAGTGVAGSFGEFTPEILEMIEAGYGGIVGAEGGLGLSGILGSFGTPLGLIGAGYGIGSLLAKLFGFGNAGAEWEKKFSGWQDQYAAEIRGDPAKWVSQLEKAYGAPGKQAATEALRGTLTAARVKEIFGFADVPELNLSEGYWAENSRFGPLAKAVALHGSSSGLSNFLNLVPYYKEARAMPPLDYSGVDFGDVGIPAALGVEMGRQLLLPPGWEWNREEGIRRIPGYGD